MGFCFLFFWRQKPRKTKKNLHTMALLWPPWPHIYSLWRFFFWFVWFWFFWFFDVLLLLSKTKTRENKANLHTPRGEQWQRVGTCFFLFFVFLSKKHWNTDAGESSGRSFVGKRFLKRTDYLDKEVDLKNVWLFTSGLELLLPELLQKQKSWSKSLLQHEENGN